MNNTNEIESTKVVSILRCIVPALNLIAFGGSVAYLIYPIPNMIFSLFGYIILLSLLGNIIVAGHGGINRCLDYSYLIMSLVSLFLIPIMNTVASSDPQNKTSQSTVVFVIYIVLFLFGALISGLRLMHQWHCCGLRFDEKPAAQPGNLKNFMRWLAIALLCLSLAAGIFMSYVLLGENTINIFYIEVFVSEYAVFWGLLILSATMLIVRLRWRSPRSLFSKVTLTIGSIVCALCMLPLIAVPVIISNADNAYTEAFGETHLSDEAVSPANGFSAVRFSLQDYFFGTRTSDYVVRENISFYKGTQETGDENTELFFDVYMPPDDGNLAQRKHPVLIRIHGGAWIMGDKGASNYAQVNKHFASQGYTIFDIQYGLYSDSSDGESFTSALVPGNVKGDFDIDDMIRHIGAFTVFLADNADEYRADIDSVFISGGSAGGQLATAAALAITGEQFTDILDTRLNVKGLIPFYPANGLSHAMGIGGTPELVDPIHLINADSPPCLIYHGTHDGIVPSGIAAKFQEAYLSQSDAPCAILWMNFAGHGSDIYTPGYYNQVFIYYMERFMHLYA